MSPTSLYCSVTLLFICCDYVEINTDDDSNNKCKKTGITRRVLTPANILVSTWYGWTLVKNTPVLRSLATSWLNASCRPRAPNFDAQYSVAPAKPMSPSSELILTMCPWLFASIDGRNALIVWKWNNNTHATTKCYYYYYYYYTHSAASCPGQPG